MSNDADGSTHQMVFRKTHGHTGRRISVTPGNSSMKHLAYGRIILNPAKPSSHFPTGERETGLIVLSGHATVTTATAKELSLGTVRRDLYSA